jgi:cation:H+ antiporter
MADGTAVAAFVVGAGLSLGASWLLVSRLERVGERFGLSEALLGLVAALAADSPEITTAVTALLHRQGAVGSGVIIGSDVFNLAALLGLGAVVAGRLRLHRKVVILGGSVALWVAVVCLATVLGLLLPEAAVGLVIVVLGPYCLLLGVRPGRLSRPPLPRRWANWLTTAVDEESLELTQAIHPQRGGRRDALVAAAALCVVIGASVAMELGASTLGREYQIASIVVGGLVLAAVTSLPNAVAAVYLAAKGRGAAAFSTALNSNTLNVLAGFLIPSAVLGLTHPSGPATLIAACYVALTVLTLALAYATRGLRTWSGWVIIGAYAAFVVALLAIS